MRPIALVLGLCLLVATLPVPAEAHTPTCSIRDDECLIACFVEHVWTDGPHFCSMTSHDALA